MRIIMIELINEELKWWIWIEMKLKRINIK